ncbi:MAG: MinD/ParA family protein [Planctomycetota bacterium]|nr:MinD/ParA family protein [Planctomycetota bacterium]MDA1252158.1 MinD/ParA family protein [Planctomycetota bacterium]
MVDQATALRGLVEKRGTEPSVPDAPSPTRARTIAVTSGKGGVGKSCIALNLAIALAETGRRVCVLDACLGLGSIDLLCGMTGYWNLSHFLNGARNLDEIVQKGPAGIRIVPGASGLTELADVDCKTQAELIMQMQRLEQANDVLIVDTGSGIHRLVRQFAAAADQALIVTAPETTAIADAYATIKALSGAQSPAALELLVNSAESEVQGKRIGDRLLKTAATFLHADVRLAGTVRNDPAVPQSVARRYPLLLDSPESPAARDIRRLACRLVDGAGSLVSPRSYFDRLTK